VLEALLRLLHPLTPFITEQLWQHGPAPGHGRPHLSLRPYPPPAEFAGRSPPPRPTWNGSRPVSALRRVRSELQCRPSKQVPLRLQAGLPATACASNASMRSCVPAEAGSIQWLGRCAGAGRRRRGRRAAAGAAGRPGRSRCRARAPGQGNRPRVRRKEKSETKLAKFTDKVPAAVVEQERQRLADWNTQLAGLREQRGRL
jgi:valyl-tRNA synthetase